MKNLLAFLVLLSHLNFTMFIPQVDEVDIKDEKSGQYDDINSLYEYINEVVLGHTDPTPEDEDDDSPRVFQLHKIDNYSFSQNVVIVKRPELFLTNKSTYPEFLTRKIPSTFTEIQTPPPEVSFQL